MANDMVNRPAHYLQHEHETIVEMVLAFGFDAVTGYARCAAWKYRARAQFKGRPEEDNAKADWYISVIEVLQKGDMDALLEWLDGRGEGSACD